MIRPLYVFRRKRSDGLFYLQDLLDEIARADARWFIRLCENGDMVRPGQIIETDDVENAFKFLEMKITPDPTHQSSLDYLNGV